MPNTACSAWYNLHLVMGHAICKTFASTALKLVKSRMSYWL